MLDTCRTRCRSLDKLSHACTRAGGPTNFCSKSFHETDSTLPLGIRSALIEVKPLLPCLSSCRDWRGFLFGTMEGGRDAKVTGHHCGCHDVGGRGRCSGRSFRDQPPRHWFFHKGLQRQWKFATQHGHRRVHGGIPVSNQSVALWERKLWCRPNPAKIFWQHRRTPSPSQCACRYRGFDSKTAVAHQKSESICS